MFCVCYFSSVAFTAVEFRRVIDAITSAAVPVIGHNSFLDFIHTTTKFVGDSPENVTQWAAQLASVFPVVFDTKVRDPANKNKQ